MGCIFVAVLAVALLEVLAQAAWVPLYFRLGIPVYRRRMVCTGEPRMAALEGPLEEAFKGGLGPPIAFRALSPDELAFRERMLAFRLLSYTPVMHGQARVDPVDRTVTVSGYLNWYPLAFLVFWYSFFALEPGPPPEDWVFWYGFPLLIVGFIYLLQRVIYARVARRIGERCGAN